jgi:hypothetical protein
MDFLYELLNNIKKRPGMFLSKKSILNGLKNSKILSQNNSLLLKGILNIRTIGKLKVGFNIFLHFLCFGFGSNAS